MEGSLDVTEMVIDEIGPQDTTVPDGIAGPFKRFPVELEDGWLEVRAFDQHGKVRASLCVGNYLALQNHIERFMRENCGAKEFALFRVKRLGSWRNIQDGG